MLNPVENAVAVVGILLLSWLSTGALRLYALRRGVLDTPNERSSHMQPTPRGGGAALAAAAIVGYVILAPVGGLDWRIVIALIGVMPTAIAGWIDDHGSLPVAPRITAHALSGLLVLPLAVGADEPTSAMAVLAIGWLAATVSAVNVVNFMDGIDGLIGLQAALFALHLVLLGASGGPGQTLGIAIAAATIGFLYWNWPRARIFLGDVGSGAVAVLGLVGAILVWREGTWSFLAVFLPLFPIFLDAAVAIVRRIRRGEPLAVAHRSHLYQRLANERRWGHTRVTLLYGAATTMAIATVSLSGSSGLPMLYVFYIAAILASGWLLDRSVPAVAQ